MSRTWNIVIVLIVSVLLGSCATIFNGSRQRVPFEAPEGTKLYEDYIDYLPIDENTIPLKRSKSEYYFKAKYNDQELKLKMESHFQSGWLIPDIFSYGWIVDLITQDWNSFDGVRLHFAGDTVNGTIVKAAYAEQYKPPISDLGVVLIGGGGYGFPFGSNDEFLVRSEEHTSELQSRGLISY